MSDAPGRVLVTGATGLVGRRLVLALQQDATAVRAVSRRPDAGAPDLPAQVERVRWDPARPDPKLFDDVDGVVHLAGQPIFGGLPTASARERIRSSRIDGTHALVDALAACDAASRPRVLVCASAVGYYGSRGDETLVESAAPGSGFLADLCVAWEAEAQRAHELGVRVVCLRIGIVLAREGGALALMARPFRLGLGGPLGDGRQWVPWIHVDDLVAVIRRALADDGLEGPVNAVAPNPARNAELTRALAKTLGRPAFLRVPAFAVRAGLGELSGELLGSKRVLPERLQSAGFDFRYQKLEDALTAELA